MDTSGIGVTLAACFFTFLIPPIPAGIAFMVILGVRKFQGSSLSLSQATSLYAVLYGICFAASCFLAYFIFMKDMYVM